jgi:hypothetical protein
VEEDDVPSSARRAVVPKPIVWILIIAVGIGAYVAGAKAGRSRYRDISSAAKRFWDDPSVKKARKRTRKTVEKAAAKAAKKLPH